MATAGTNVALSGSGGKLKTAHGFHVLEIARGSPAIIKLFIADSSVTDLQDFARKSAYLVHCQYTQGEGRHLILSEL